MTPARPNAALDPGPDDRRGARAPGGSLLAASGPVLGHAGRPGARRGHRLSASARRVPEVGRALDLRLLRRRATRSSPSRSSTGSAHLAAGRRRRRARRSAPRRILFGLAGAALLLLAGLYPTFGGLILRGRPSPRGAWPS
ncbi:hypothetical protein ACU4GR_00180 [Methylobacterium oryzae CBMB20]